MKAFQHFDAENLDDACRLLCEYKGEARVNAGGTDLLTVLRADVLPSYPKAIINLKTIPDLGYIREENGYLQIGAMTTLDTIARSKLIRDRYPALAEAAQAVASPQIRNMGTLGGNICQDSRCWYYRYPSRLGGGPLNCNRKGSGGCLAVRGDNRYHAILGGGKCFGVCPSDTAIALTALDAQLIIASVRGERRLAIAEFYHVLGNNLEPDELIREIVVPIQSCCNGQSFVKCSQRKAIDFAIASAAAVVTVKNGICADARIVLGAVAPTPVRASAAEQILTGKPVSEELLETAAEAALSGARPLSGNAYKIRIAKTLLKRAVRKAVNG